MRLADLLSLAAAPVFASMALLTVYGSADPALMLCGAGAWSAGGMVPMYILMTLFHTPPWIRLLGASRRAIGFNPPVRRSPARRER